MISPILANKSMNVYFFFAIYYHFLLFKHSLPVPLQKLLVRQVFFGEGDHFYYSILILAPSFSHSTNKSVNVYFFLWHNYTFVIMHFK